MEGQDAGSDHKNYTLASNISYNMIHIVILELGNWKNDGCDFSYKLIIILLNIMKF
jgi:hypothetical protein